MVEKTSFSIEHEQPYHREPIRDRPRVVLVAVDDSLTARHAMSYAAGLARRNGAELTLLHVHEPLPNTLWIDAVGASSVELVAEDGGTELLAQFANLVHEQYGIEANYLLRDGLPAKEIARVADEVHADVVVVGASCSRFHLTSPSIPGKLMKHSSWPLIVVS